MDHLRNTFKTFCNQQRKEQAVRDVQAEEIQWHRRTFIDPFDSKESVPQLLPGVDKADAGKKLIAIKARLAETIRVRDGGDSTTDPVTEIMSALTKLTCQEETDADAFWSEWEDKQGCDRPDGWEDPESVALMRLSLVELKKVAARNRISGRSKMDKVGLVEALIGKP